MRDAMLLHSHGSNSEGTKLASAKAVLNLLSDGMAASNPLAPSLRAAVAQLRTHSDYYIAHEYLEAFNNPCYLLEFVSRAEQHGLTHAGDSEPHAELSATYGQNVQLNHSLVALGQPREMRQQYLDFAVGRNFRKSLLVHRDRAGQILVSPDLERLADLRWAGSFVEVEAEPNAPKGRLAFRSHKNRPLYSSDATVIAIVRALSAAWPACLSFNELLALVQPGLAVAQDDAANRKAVLDALQTLFRLNSLRYTLEPSPYNAEATAGFRLPRVIPGAAYLFERRQDPAFGVGMFNLWHDTINLQLQEAEAFVLRQIDGKNSRKQLATLLRDALNRGTMPGTDGKWLKGQRNLDGVADNMVGKLLELLERQGLAI